MTKRVREGSITLDDNDAQSLEVVRQVGTVLFMIRIDHLIRDEFACNLLLNDLVMMNLMLTMLLEVQTKRILSIVSHKRWSMLAVVIFRGVCF